MSNAKGNPNRLIIALVGTVVTTLALAGCGVSTSNPPTPTSASSSDGSAVTDDPSATPENTPEPNDYVAQPPTSVKPEPKVNGGPPMVSQIKTKQKVVFLTVDDGFFTDPRTTEVLKEYGIPITQFLTDNAVNGDRYAYFKDISKMNGQTIQNHTMSHPDLRTLGYGAQKAQICDTNAKFKENFGTTPWMLRPPYGSTNESVRKAANACGIDYIVMWSTTMPQDKLRYQVGNKLRPGDIILTHWSEKYHKWLRGLIEEVKSQGFKFGALQDYLPKK